jgi:hypothetical protein
MRATLGLVCGEFATLRLTIVFVHGAWGDVTGFGESIRALRDRGFAAYASYFLGSASRRLIGFVHVRLG